MAVLVAAVVGLIAYQGSLPGSKGNGYTELLERLGSQVSSNPRGLDIKTGNSIVLGTGEARDSRSAEWSMSNYEFTNILPHAASCSMSVYVTGTHLTGANRSSFARVELNDTLVSDVRFASIETDYPVDPGRLAPRDVIPERVPMTPLFNPRGLVFPVSSHYCAANEWRVRIGVHGASWPIDRVGVIARFAPAAMTTANLEFGTILLAIAIVSLLVLGTHVLLSAIVREYGRVMLLLTVAAFVCALVTHDEWDFPVWIRFVDLIAIGHGNPAFMWGGTPLWPIAMGLLAPIVTSVFVLTGDASAQIPAVCLKSAMALAACANAFFICRFARPKLRRYLFPVMLLSPYVLYELAGGYRELFAGSFFLIGASLALRGRFAIAAVALAAAASISESLAPLVFLPAALRLATTGIEVRSIGYAAIDVLCGIAPLAFEWFVLVPHSVAATTISTRVTEAYRFGGGSWFSSLDGYGLLPGWVAVHSTNVVLGLLFVLALPFAVSIVRDCLAPNGGTAELRKRTFGNFLGVVAAFFLAYRGIDPSTWYTLWIVAAFYFVRFDPLSPMPLLLSCVQAVAFYAILGIGDFANATYVMPDNESLVGVLGKAMLATVLAVNLTIAALYGSLVSRGRLPLFGRGSRYFLVLFFASVATSAIKMYPVDVVFCTCSAILILITFSRYVRTSASSADRMRSIVVDYAGLGTIVLAGIGGGTQNGVAALVAFVSLLLGLAYGFGMCDIAIAASSVLLVATQHGFGWVSIAGYVSLSLLALFSLRGAYTVSALATPGRSSFDDRIRKA